MNDIPNSTTITFSRERQRKADAIEEIVSMLDESLRDQSLEARGEQIIDATLVPVPKQRNTREENNDIKSCRPPDGWEENSNRLQQMDLVARWMKKIGICINAEHGFIRGFDVT